jgi:hypothetical protein
MIHILAADSLTIDFVRFFVDLNCREEEYHADLHENAERDDPEPGSGVIGMRHCVHTNKSLTYSCAVISTVTDVLGCALALPCSCLARSG